VAQVPYEKYPSSVILTALKLIAGSNVTSSLTNKRVVLGITGSIAAYKSAELTRRLRDAGADVRVVMTKAAEAFITPLTMQALSGQPVHTDLLDSTAEAAMGHIELAKWADIVLVAPASANFMSRISSGRCDDLLTTLCSATDAPIVLAPAMNQSMWRDSATQSNHQLLKQRGVLFFGPDEGSQACGDVGLGRMLEVDQLVDQTAHMFATGELAGKRVVITAGPTREAIDPVRYISNRSSGKMGFALAEACVEAGAKVVLIAGPVSLATPERVSRIDVVSAQEMLAAALVHMPCDIFIGAAAVADYGATTISTEKIKKTSDTLQLTLRKTPDVVANIAALPNRPYTVGFAAETSQLEAYANQKRLQKGLDMVVANDVSNTAIGFDSDDNAVIVIDQRCRTEIAQTTKQKLARQLVSLMSKALDLR
jgi:phosphopantothenoylcysteine decarboxylase / phosphopantothenate---cysteine ligase